MKGIQKIRELMRSGTFSARYDGLVKVVSDGEDLILFNYTDLCQRQRAWDDVTLLSRGLILNARTGEVVAYPFPKFFNWGEHQGEIPKEPFVVTEKLDGSMGILYRKGGEVFLATRGSFSSSQAKRGTEMLRGLREIERLPDEWTLLFEIILTEGGSNIVKYDYEGLVLLGGYHRFTGQELPSSTLEEWANRLGCRRPKVYAFETLEEVLAQKDRLPADLEGYVIRFASGLRLKLKGDAYLDVLKEALGVSRGKVLAALSQGEDAYRTLWERLPEELQPHAEKLAADLAAQAKEIEEEALAFFARAPRDDRKTFALWVQENIPYPFKRVMFQLLDQKTPNWYALLQ